MLQHGVHRYGVDEGGIVSGATKRLPRDDRGRLQLPGSAAALSPRTRRHPRTGRRRRHDGTDGGTLTLRDLDGWARAVPFSHDRSPFEVLPVSDHAGLVAAWRRILDDAPLRHWLGKTALHEARTGYACATVALRIAFVYQHVVGGPVPSDWTSAYDPALTLADADLSCRFRRDPHLS